MLKHVIVLSGPPCSGKSSLAEQLKARFNAEIVKTRDLIARALSIVDQDPEAFKAAGLKLDGRTGGKWIVDQLRDSRPKWFAEASPEILVIDYVGNLGQIEHLRKGFGNRVVHIHLTASQAEIVRRIKKNRKRTATISVQAPKTSPDAKVESLISKADIVIETDRNTQSDVLVRASARIGLLASFTQPLVDVVVGGQYGSEGKGNIVSYLAPEYSVLVRVGSVNAGHKVYLDPVYAFHQLPSGTLHNEQAQIILGPGTQIRLGTLQKEIGDCHLSYDRLSIDPQAMIIEDSDIKKEAPLVKTIGSTGQGVGRAAVRRILRPIDGSVRLAKDIIDLKPYIRSTAEMLERAYQRGDKILLEGTQGTSLSLYHGYYPHVTSRDTTVSGCMAEAGIPPRMVRRTVMVCRSFPIRVESPKGRGLHSGPMGQEISLKTIADRSGIPLSKLKSTERTTTTNKKRRMAEFDWEQLRKSALLNAPTDIALTFVDYLTITNKNARRFEQLDDRTIDFVEEVERVASAPVSLISTRFHWRSIIDRRRW